MRFKTTRIVAAIAVIGAVAAGGAAFTDTTNQPTNQALGYGVTSISGGDITGISYQVSADGATVDSVTLTSEVDLATANNGSPASVYLAFNSDGFASGGDASCAITASSALAPSSTVTCTVSNSEQVANVTSVHIAVTNGASNGDTLG
jgi:hypothetical protein